MTQQEQVTREPTRAKLGDAAAGTDLVLREAQNWSSHSHRELYEAVHRDNEPGRVGELAQDWERMGFEIGESAVRMAERLRGTEEGWQGEAADSARGAIHELARWSSDAGSTAGDLGNRIGEQGRVMEVAKTSMPEPKDVKFDDELASSFGSAGVSKETSALVGFFAATADMHQQLSRADSAHDEAVVVMERMERDSRLVDGSTPRFEPPPNPIRDGVQSANATTPFQPSQKPVNGLPDGAEPANAIEPGAQPLGEPVSPSGESTAPDAAVPPLSPQQGGPEATAQIPALSTPASSTPASAPPLEHTPQTYGDRGGSYQAPGGRVPVPDGYGGNPGGRPLGWNSGPDSTIPQSTTPQSTRPSSTTSPYGVDQPTIKYRPVPSPGSTDIPAGSPIGRVPGGQGPAGQGPGGGPGGRSGWSGAIPPIPSTSGPGAGGSLGSGGSGGSGGSLGSGGSGGSNVGAGGRASVGTGPGGGLSGGSAGGGASGSSSSGAGGVGAPGAASGRGRGGEDEERRAKYVESTPIVEVPGADLPPPVIGAGKPKKKDD